MKYNKLGDSNLTVSEICLGTMTFGQQNSLEEAKTQLDYAFSQGVNFIDTAEMYPVPPMEQTQGKTEEYIGEWLINQQRDQIILATKVAGPAALMPWVRGIDHCLDRKNIEMAVNDSLRRLKTDYIDLYQIHWPDRYVPLFGAPDYDPKQERDSIPIVEQLEVFGDLVKAGKIRYLGLSNETPWGVCEFCHQAEKMGLPKVVSIQNAYSLINRVFEINLAEACRFNNIGLLPYSCLGFGYLTGKHINGVAENSRLALFSGFGGRYDKPNRAEAVQAYVELAHRFNLTPAQLALGFVRSRWFVSSTIIGATTLEQLKENLSCIEIELTPEMFKEIDRIHSRYPNPTP